VRAVQQGVEPATFELKSTALMTMPPNHINDHAYYFYQKLVKSDNAIVTGRLRRVLFPELQRIYEYIQLCMLGLYRADKEV